MVPIKKTDLIERKIWILWLQGVSNAPFIVKKCVDSWINENPTWDIIVLDKDNLMEYIDLEIPKGIFESLPIQKQSNLIRLQLLSDYGGVWVDATTLCMNPLDAWLHKCIDSGFFAFYKPGPDKMMSNWFMACKRGCPITMKLRKNYTLFFTTNKFNNNGWFKQLMLKILRKLLSRNEKTTKYWFSPLVIKLFRVYPYPVFHYMFERLISTDSECHHIWKNTKKISAKNSQTIRKIGIISPLTENIKNEIDKKKTNIYKLTWKYDHRKYSASTVLYYLLEGRHI